jgi:Uma2 family endonuclease
MSAEPLRRLTSSEYLALDRAAHEKHEFADGEAFAMSGASERHNLIALNIGTEINLQLRDRPCRVYVSDLRVAVSRLGPFYYPDVVALCGQPELLDAEGDTLLNPSALVEILSRSTEAYDRGVKAQGYRSMPSVKEYLLVSQDALRVEHYRRNPSGEWLLADHVDPAEAIELASIGCTLKLAHAYAKVDL